MSPTPAIVSIHDVTPETLPAVQSILDWLHAGPERPVTLLVVPGAGWSGDSLAALRRLHDSGCELAGHGWRHRSARPASFGHWLHSRVLSRDTAEHLSRSVEEIAEIIGGCYGWFGDVGLPPPRLYVPPAWAMGAIAPKRLADLPFRLYEFLGGVYDAARDSYRRLPLVGYEADTRARAWALRVSNGVNRAYAAATGRPLRVAIHPADLQLRLSSDVRALMRRNLRFVSYGEL